MSWDDFVLSRFTCFSFVWSFPFFPSLSFFPFLYTQSAEYGAEEIGSRRCPDAVREWGSCWCICHLVCNSWGGSSLAEIHCTHDEPRVGIADWEQLVSPLLVCLGVVRYGIGIERRQLNTQCEPFNAKNNTLNS